MRDLYFIAYYEDKRLIAKRHGYETVKAFLLDKVSQDVPNRILAERMCVTIATIGAWLKRLGVPARSKGGSKRAITEVRIIGKRCQVCGNDVWYKTNRHRCVTCHNIRKGIIN